jgi:arsenate reductase
MNGMEKIDPKTTIYYNKSCSKSQCALEALKTTGVDYEIINYLETPPTLLELKEIISKLNCSPHDLIRTKESIYLEKFANKELSDEEWIIAMHENPILIERPIIVNGKTATIARDEEAIANSLVR